MPSWLCCGGAQGAGDVCREVWVANREAALLQVFPRMLSQVVEVLAKTETWQVSRGVSPATPVHQPKPETVHVPSSPGTNGANRRERKAAR